MIWVWIAIATLAAIVVVPVLVGFVLPERYEGSAQRRFDWTPDEVWEAIHDAMENPVTGRQCRSVECGDRDESSLPNWIEDMGSTQISVTTIESERPVRVVRRFVDSVVPMTAESTIEIEAVEEGTLVSVRNAMNIRLGTWHVPIFRFFTAVTGGANRGCREYLENLTKTES